MAENERERLEYSGGENVSSIFPSVVLGHARDIFLSRETLEDPRRDGAEGPDTGQRQRRGTKNRGTGMKTSPSI